MTDQPNDLRGVVAQAIGDVLARDPACGGRVTNGGVHAAAEAALAVAQPIIDRLTAERDAIVTYAERDAIVTYIRRREAAHKVLADDTSGKDGRHMTIGQRFERKGSAMTCEMLASQIEMGEHWKASNQ